MENDHAFKELRFPELVRECFLFLERDFGYSMVESRYGKIDWVQCVVVRYESKYTSVQFFYDEFESSISVRVIKLKPEFHNHEYNFLPIFRALAPGYKGPMSFTARGYTELKDQLCEISNLLQKHCIALLRDDDHAARLVEEEYNRLSREAMSRYAAGAAWYHKDYAKVVQLYQSIQSELTEEEKEQLEYAKKQVQ